MSVQAPGRLRPFRPYSFGRYTLLSPLSTGGMGELFLARLEGAQGFHKLCVIKKIRSQLVEDVNFIERFVNEAKTLVKLSHGAIAQVLDMGLVNDEPYLSLEYVDGKDLRRVAARARDRGQTLPLSFVLFVMGRVLDALAYVHRKRDDEDEPLNLVHRDVAPQNILVSYEGEVKVIDFGLVKSALNMSQTHPSITLGTYMYMAPEQLRHETVDRRSDLYSAGVCLYELLSGRNPFDTLSPEDQLDHLASPEFESLDTVQPSCPPAVCEVVTKALSPKPEDRFQTSEEFRGRLMACLPDADSAANSEPVARVMRELFEAEFRSERQLLTVLREAAVPPDSDALQSEFALSHGFAAAHDPTRQTVLQGQVGSSVISVETLVPRFGSASELRREGKTQPHVELRVLEGSGGSWEDDGRRTQTDLDNLTQTDVGGLTNTDLGNVTQTDLGNITQTDITRQGERRGRANDSTVWVDLNALQPAELTPEVGAAHTWTGPTLMAFKRRWAALLLIVVGLASIIATVSLLTQGSSAVATGEAASSAEEVIPVGKMAQLLTVWQRVDRSFGEQERVHSCSDSGMAALCAEHAAIVRELERISSQGDVERLQRRMLTLDDELEQFSR